MGPSDICPLLPLPYQSVLFPGRKLQISSTNRQDIIGIIASYYNGALASKTKQKPFLIGCIPLRSPLLSPDGKQLIKADNAEETDHDVPDAAFAKKDDLFNFGTLARIHSVEGGQSGELKMVVEGVTRFKLEKITQEKPYFAGRVKPFNDEVDLWDPALKGAFAQLKELSREFFQILRLTSLVSRTPGMPPLLARQLEAFVSRKDISEAGVLADFIAILGQTSYEDKLRLLSASHIVARVQMANDLLQKQISAIQGNTRIITITDSSTGTIDKSRQFETTNLIKKDGRMPFGFSLPPGSGGGGQSEEDNSELEELKKRMNDAQLSLEAQKVAAKEMKRLQRMNPMQAEYNVIRTYLENLADIPWTKVTNDRLDASTIARARKQLDDDHYGLEKIKKRLLEYLAVLKLKQNANLELEQQIEALNVNLNKAGDENGETAAAKKTEKAIEVDSEALQALKEKRMIDKSPILLLVGPPGTGKTSLAKSIATALGRKFHRISLGGVRDEAEIRGHRRTYVAAMPGLIVSGLKKVGVANPVFLLDEIDKVGSQNFHGDPSAAMLEVLDPEQNYTFMDHYVNIPIDLSKVLFIATANTLDTIPPPLLDRMETIHLSGYTTLEKRHIATRHLIPKQVQTNGLHYGDVELPDDVVDKIITSYTRESGVRNLEREIGSVCRYKAVQYTESKDTSSPTSTTSTTSSSSPEPPVSTTTTTTTTPTSTSTSTAFYNPLVTLPDLELILGIERYEEELALDTPPRPGVITGLVAFSNLGQGSILFIEILDMPGGKGAVQLTGKLGDVLKESVEVALSWVKSHAFALGLTENEDENIMRRRDIHVHCPAGAVPKDGPSAGLAHTVALVSLFSGKAVPPTMAMTGEVSLRGRVMPVGGIKEKLIGALRAGVKTVLLPQGNRKDVKDCPDEVKQGLKIVFVGQIWEALRVVWPGEGEKWGALGWEVESRL